MARERTADPTTDGSDASGGASLLDRDSYRRLADAAVSAAAETTDEDDAPDAAGAPDSGATTSDD